MARRAAPAPTRNPRRFVTRSPRSRQVGLGHRQVDRAHSPEIDDQIELSRLFHWRIFPVVEATLGTEHCRAGTGDTAYQTRSRTCDSASWSQKRMSISRYIVVAVVRYSHACSRLPVRAHSF